MTKVIDIFSLSSKTQLGYGSNNSSRLEYQSYASTSSSLSGWWEGNSPEKCEISSIPCSMAQSLHFCWALQVFSSYLFFLSCLILFLSSNFWHLSSSPAVFLSFPKKWPASRPWQPLNSGSIDELPEFIHCWFRHLTYWIQDIEIWVNLYTHLELC